MLVYPATVLTGSDWHRDDNIIPPMRIPRAWHAAAPVGEFHFVVFGGHRRTEDGGLEIWSSVEIFDIRTQLWMDLPDLNQPQSSPTMTVVGRKIFPLGGGWTHGGTFYGTEMLDLDRLHLGWQIQRACPRPR